MKRVLLLALFLSFALGLLGCSGPENLKTEKGNMYFVKDADGNKITFSQKPTRILPMGSGVPEIVIDITGPDRLIAIPDYYTNENSSFVAGKAMKVKHKVPRIMPVEAIIKLKPDLVLTYNNFEKAKIQTLRDMGVKVVTIKTPGKILEVERSVQLVADAVGESARGKEIVANMENVFDLIKSVNDRIPVKERKRILAISVEGAFGAKGGLFDDLCKYACLQNAAGEVELPPGGRISKEGILKLKPDVILLPTATRMLAEEKRKSMLKEFLDDPSYRTLKAIQENSIIQMPDKNYRYCVSHYAAEGAYRLASMTYPQYYKDKVIPKL